MEAAMQSTGRSMLKCCVPYWRVLMIPRGPDRSFAHANSTQSCRPREALLSSGPLCRKCGTLFQGQQKPGGFGMKRTRLSLAVAYMAASAAVGAALWPHARDASAILAAQDAPAQLADIRID